MYVLGQTLAIDHNMKVKFCLSHPTLYSNEQQQKQESKILAQLYYCGEIQKST